MSEVFPNIPLTAIGEAVRIAFAVPPSDVMPDNAFAIAVWLAHDLTGRDGRDIAAGVGVSADHVAAALRVMPARIAEDFEQALVVACLRAALLHIHTHGLTHRLTRTSARTQAPQPETING